MRTSISKSTSITTRCSYLARSQRNLFNVYRRSKRCADFSDLPELAWQVYRLCEQSSSDPVTGIASDVSRLYVGLRSLQDRLLTDTFSANRTKEIHNLLNDCYRTLMGLDSMIQSTSRNGQTPWNNPSNENFYGLKQIKSDLESNISTINALSRNLSRCV